jgi:acetyl esterase
MGLTKKSLAGLLVLLLVIAFAVISYRWTFTPHGRLDYRAALSLHLLSFERVIQPDPAVDFELPIPVNLIYAVSFALPAEDVSKTEELAIPTGDAELPARAYWPLDTDRSEKPLPVIVFYHGGGFVVGSVDIFDSLTRALANATASVVVSVGYRLAPAHPFPAAVEDAYSALAWVAAHVERFGGDRAKLVVAGESAGANLATVAALRARDESGPPIAAQVLYYPPTDFTAHPYPSREKFTEHYGFSARSGLAMINAYVGHVEDLRNPWISPYHADSLADMPPTLMVTAGFDPLVDSARAYADRLEQSGVPVTRAHYPTTLHGFMNIRPFPQRREALDRTGQFMRNLSVTEPEGY